MDCTVDQGAGLVPSMWTILVTFDVDNFGDDQISISRCCKYIISDSVSRGVFFRCVCWMYPSFHISDLKSVLMHHNDDVMHFGVHENIDLDSSVSKCLRYFPIEPFWMYQYFG